MAQIQVAVDRVRYRCHPLCPDSTLCVHTAGQSSQWVIPFLIVTLELLLNWLKAEVHARVKRRTLDGIDGQSDWLSYRFVVAVAVLVLCLATQLTLLTMLVREAAVLRTTEVLSLEWLSSLGMVLTVTGITFVTHFIILFGKHHVYHSWAYAFMRLHRAFTSWRLRKAKVNLRKARQAFSDRYGEFEDATSRLHAVYPNEPLQEYHMTVEMRKAYDACFKGTTSDATTDRSPDATPHASPDIDGRAGEQNLRRRVVHRR